MEPYFEKARRDAQEVTVDRPSHEIGDDGAKAVAEALTKNRTLTKLE